MKLFTYVVNCFKYVANAVADVVVRSKAVVVTAAALPAVSFAQTGTDYSGILDAVDFATAATAIIAIFGLVAVMKVAMAGGRKVLGAIR